MNNWGIESLLDVFIIQQHLRLESFLIKEIIGISVETLEELPFFS